MTNLSIPEPDPISNNNPSIHDLAVEDLKREGYPDYLIRNIQDRKELGLKKYGTILQAGNGRNALIDALQESLDAIVYIKQAMLDLEDDDCSHLKKMFYIAAELADDLSYWTKDLAITKDELLIESKPVQETSYSVLGDK